MMVSGNDRQRLLIIPCCARKRAGGRPWQPNPGTFEGVISKDVIDRVLEARIQILNAITGGDKRYHEPKYKKNLAIKAGPDFGRQDISMEYMPAIDRYYGTLYTAYPGMPDVVKRSINTGSGPSILIFSALYGPLHPLDCIQDYNLVMGDSNTSRVWSIVFPVFLASYIKAFGIKRVELFFGVSTTYFRIAHKAVSPLIRAGDLLAILYEVQNGNLRETPRNHGLILANRLGCKSIEPLTREITVREIHA
jgi:hypothetical protein